MAETSMCWLVTMHHIVSDGWSIGSVDQGAEARFTMRSRKAAPIR